MIGFNIRKKSLNSSSSAEIYKTNDLKKKKDTIVQNHSGLQEPSTRISDEILSAGWREGKPSFSRAPPRHRQGTQVEALSSFLFHLTVGIVKGILLLCFTLGSEINLLAYGERVMSFATEKPNQQTAMGVLLAGASVLSLWEGEINVWSQKNPSWGYFL